MLKILTISGIYTGAHIHDILGGISGLGVDKINHLVTKWKIEVE